jgi:hypothetical protein
MDTAQLKQTRKKFTRAIDFRLDNIVAGFITEFAVDTTISYNATKKEFLKVPKGIYIRSMYTLVNILLYNKCVMIKASYN